MPDSQMVSIENLRGTFGTNAGTVVGDPDAPTLARGLQPRDLLLRQRRLLRHRVANVHAVEDVSFSVKTGQTLSLVGEPGCGKSTTGRSNLRPEEPRSGQVRLGDTDIMALGAADLREARRDMQMVFQGPVMSLNPKKSPDRSGRGIDPQL